MFLSKITILHIFSRFGDHTTKKKIHHTRRHKLKPNICIAFLAIIYFLNLNFSQNTRNKIPSFLSEFPLQKSSLRNKIHAKRDARWQFGISQTCVFFEEEIYRKFKHGTFSLNLNQWNSHWLYQWKYNNW